MDTLLRDMVSLCCSSRLFYQDLMLVASFASCSTADFGRLVHQLHRNLAHHLGSHKGFFCRWIPSISAVYSLPDLDQDSKSVVDGWIAALFGEGISDDLMQSAFHSFVISSEPTKLLCFQVHKTSRYPPSRPDHLQAVPRRVPSRRNRHRLITGGERVLPSGALELHASWNYPVACR